MAHHLTSVLTLLCILVVTSGCRKKNDGGSNSRKPNLVSYFAPASIQLKTREDLGNVKELVDGTLTFVDSNGDKWEAPQGTLTDGATVPRLLLPITDDRFHNDFLKAAVVHDAYCQEFNKPRCPPYRTRRWQAVHRMFYEACLAGGTSPLKAKSMFAGVLLGGPTWDDPDNPLAQAPPDVLTKGYTGAKSWIEKTDPTVEEIEADSKKRGQLLFKLYKLETAVLAALQDAELAKADALLGEEETLLNKELERVPDDIMLLNFKGYWHKNRAILCRDSDLEDKIDGELRNSAQAFNAVIARVPDEPSALNGLGSVSILRGNLDIAEQYVRKALSIAPEYQAAQNDLKLVLKLRQSQSPE